MSVELVAWLRKVAPKHIEGTARSFAFNMEGLCLQELNAKINEAADLLDAATRPDLNAVKLAAVGDEIETLRREVETWKLRCGVARNAVDRIFGITQSALASTAGGEA